MFEFLSEFWDSITEATSGTVEFFQNIGLAVAGALGNVFLFPLKILVEFGLAFGWVFQNLILILSKFISPFSFVYYFFRDILAYLENVPPAENFVTISTQYTNFIQTFPMFNYIQIVISGGILIIGLFAFVRLAKL